MKKQIYIPFFLLACSLFLLLPNTLLAKSEELTKSIEKSFPIEKTGSLKIVNQFGKVELIQHDKNTVEVSVKITVESSNDEKAQRKLDEIEIIFSSTSNSVEMRTSFGKAKNNFNGSFQIDYIVKAPSSLSLDINNQFGDVFIGEWKGATNLDIGYGSLTAGKLLADNNDVNLEFSKGTVGLINKGTLELAYSDRFNLDKTKDLSIRSSFSSYEIQSAEHLVCRSEYDDIEIEEVNRIELNASFSGVKIGKLFVNGDLSNEYGAIKLGYVSKGFEGLKLENSFSNIKVEFEHGSQFTFECDADFGDISLPKDATVSVDKKDHTSNYKKGSIGSGDNLAHVSVEVDYGSASLDID
jgi:hypothetical protein